MQTFLHLSVGFQAGCYVLKWCLLLQTITRLSNGPFPRRVLCTGLGGGGAYATLCAVWAAVTFPLAQIRHITFGAPAVRVSITLQANLLSPMCVKL